MKIVPPGALVHLTALAWTSTWRIEKHDIENLERARALTPCRSLVGYFWHQSLLMAAAAHHHQHVSVLASRSTDGGLITAHLKGIGIEVVRGSSHRGAVQAVRELNEAVQRGRMLAFAPDGPRGPAKQAKQGVVELARRHRIPLLPMAFAPLHAWEFSKAWDAFRLPWPGTRVAVIYGEPVMYPPEDPDADEIARRCREASERLDALEQRALRLVGR